MKPKKTSLAGQGVRFSRSISNEEIVRVAQVESAIQTLKRALKTQSAKYLIVEHVDGGLLLKTTDQSGLLETTNPSLAQMRFLNLKVKRPRGGARRLGYAVGESSETVTAISENSKDYSEKNKEFLDGLASTLVIASGVK